ncbi:uncharacterized protein IUM83_11054 [Phytophthora cinnamomi]|uniref:uncharacterized protein n=1 Tax=Phytophthora cinnamomi TaxID=4785 RepID=UPI00355ABD81|nr:hypothetical protein IUM83_11054 [Phytophthora cinnamomi]
MSTMLPSDEDLLMDESSVLAFLADCEMDNEVDAPAPTVSSNSSTPTRCDTLVAWSDSTSSASSPERPIATDKKKSWRQRRKEEVLTLREVVKQLSAELERLKLAAGVHSTLPTAIETLRLKSTAKPQAAHKTEASVIWEGIAGRQSMVRQRSEEENAKLHEVLKLQLQQAKSLQRTIKRKLKEDLVSSSMDLTKQYRLDIRGITPPANNKEVFNQLVAGLDEMYEGVDAFFEKTGMMELPCCGRRNNSLQSRAMGKFVEFLDSYALPFDLRKTAKVIWTREKMESGSSSLYFLQNFTAESNTHMTSFCFALSIEGLEFRVVMRVVTRKYVEKGRVVFIKRSLIEPIYENMSLALVETTRMVLKRGGLSSLGPTTVMQTHREAEIRGGGVSFEVSDPRLDIGLEHWENNITRHNNDVEDQLIRAS